MGWDKMGWDEKTRGPRISKLARRAVSVWVG